MNRCFPPLYSIVILLIVTQKQSIPGVKRGIFFANNYASCYFGTNVLIFTNTSHPATVRCKKNLLTRTVRKNQAGTNNSCSKTNEQYSILFEYILNFLGEKHHPPPPIRAGSLSLKFGVFPKRISQFSYH